MKAASAPRKAAERRGRRAERIAALYLRLKGYRVLGTRVKTGLGEIDLVLRRGRQIVFAEVKSRQTLDEAFHAIPPKAQKRLISAAKLWLAKNPRYASYDARFDAIFLAPGKWPRHLVNAFGLPS